MSKIGVFDGKPNWEVIEREFKKPFPEGELKVRVGQKLKTGGKCLALPYIDARLVAERLDDVVGPENWSDKYTVVSSTGVVCELTVFGVTKSDAGQSREDKSDEGEAKDLKSAFSDAFKRAGVKFGIGQFLYSLPKQFEEMNGKYLKRRESDIVRDILRKTSRLQSPQPKPAPRKTVLPSNGKGFNEGQKAALNEILKRIKATEKSMLDPFVEECFDGQIKAWVGLTGSNVDKFIEFMNKKVPEAVSA